ncbi:MAG: tetratricopeptide repeat protein, partial [Planctomycetota bacterium]
MSPSPPWKCMRYLTLRNCLPLLLGGLILTHGAARPALAQVEAAPTASYLLTFHSFYDGEYKDALRQFQDEWRGAIKTHQSRWIDSICYHTMIGECYYHMGQPDDALQHYTSALELFVAFSGWMMRVNFEPAIRPARSSMRIPWGPSKRGAALGYYPPTITIGQGRLDNNQAFREGGLVQLPVLFPIRVQEIVRCTTLAIRRRTELLGPLTRFDPLTGDLIAALSRAGLPNHWSQAWVDVQYGLALVAGGKIQEALPVLRRSVLAAGQFDHPLTSTALLELGRLALLREEHQQASDLFREASIAAAHYPDWGVLEEALRYGALAHLAANHQGVYPILEPASQWAGVKARDMTRFRASLALSTAENLAVLGQTRQAGLVLDRARAAIGRRPLLMGRTGARLNYLNAMVLFQQRNVADGDKMLNAALAFMQRGSLWLYQIYRLDQLYTSGQVNTRSPISPRAAMELYGYLLRDPDGSDWVLQPMESLAVLRTPHPESLEHWFLIAWHDREEHETALEIADRARRHRFYSSLAYGGRLQSLRWILEGPKEVLDQKAQLNRQDLLAQYPAYGELARQAREVRAAVDAMPLVPPDGEAFRRLQGLFEQLGAISLHQEAVLREMAVRREPAALVFPPLKPTKEIQSQLPEGSVLLAFFDAAGYLYGFLLDQDQYSYWRVKATPVLLKRLQGLLRAMGHYDQNRELDVKELTSTEWQKDARELLDHILDGSRADFAADFPELVVVPDGLMWYVPFESLLVDVNGQVRPLISRFRIRYAPTVSLAVPDGRGRSPTATTGVVVRRLSPRDDDAVAQAAFDDLAKVVPRAVALPKSPLPAPSALYASRIDQLVV